MLLSGVYSMVIMNANCQGNPPHTSDLMPREEGISPQWGFNDRLLTVPSHPLGIKPTGNSFTTSENIKAAAGIFSVLPDELIVQVLEFLQKYPSCG